MNVGISQMTPWERAEVTQARMRRVQPIFDGENRGRIEAALGRIIEHEINIEDAGETFAEAFEHIADRLEALEEK